MAKHGRYTIGRKVADGGMAEIFLATQTGHEGFAKPVILKRIHSAIYADPQFRNMFIDEAHISMSLSHSNIVQVLDLGVGNGRYFLVLEFVDGWDLGRVLHRGAQVGMLLPRELGLHVAGEVCRALAYAHGKSDGDRPLGIVHRDVSPHNILLSEHGEVKLTDFGIAKAMNKREHTGTGVVKGKVAFMSPEQALGKPIDARSDLFGLGTVLYLLMARTRPFGGPTDLETLLRVQKADFRPPLQAAPDLPPEVAAVIERSMRLEPADRYQSAEEMLADIERVARAVYQPVGQSEIKRWLAALSARDGVPSIGKATTAAAAARAGTGTGSGAGSSGVGHVTGSGDLVEGKDVVLSDSSQEQEFAQSDDDDIIDGQEATSLAVVGPGGTPSEHRRTARARGIAREAREELTLPLPEDDQEAALANGRRSESELVLPIPDGDDGRPRRRRARGGIGVWVVSIGLLVVAGAAGAGRYFGQRGDGSQAGELPPALAPEPPPPPAAAEPATAKEPPEKAKEPEKTEKAAKEPEKAEKAAKEPEKAAAKEPEKAEKAAKEPEKAEKAEKAKDKPRNKLDDLKDMMVSDPSQLPAAPAPSAPAPPTPPKAPAAEPPPAPSAPAPSAGESP